MGNFFVHIAPQSLSHGRRRQGGREGMGQEKVPESSSSGVRDFYLYEGSSDAANELDVVMKTSELLS